ncbi:hypothetical protein [Paenibacillus thiaminolyticus]|uniref:hypothetical protein n=1 Tax=Paenibacillus thiaminolyticus TaxID=49283 RepID=UPI002543B8EA|nr:hypothetical protein [Paenibacillus thiaminolyticus]WII38738.1 hypothetical protein O0V01_06405 [Paenibacillus thiaminolyticus]
MKPKQSKWNSALKRFIMTVLFLSVVIGLSACTGLEAYLYSPSAVTAALVPVAKASGSDAEGR